MLEHVRTDTHAADVFTESLPGPKCTNPTVAVDISHEWLHTSTPAQKQRWSFVSTLTGMMCYDVLRCSRWTESEEPNSWVNLFRSQASCKSSL